MPLDPRPLGRKRKRLPRESPRRRRERRIYLILAAAQLKAHPRCQVRWKHGQRAGRHDWTAKQCDRRATQNHHIRGRGKYYLNPRYFLSTCGPDHRWITDHGKQAAALGYIERDFRA